MEGKRHSLTGAALVVLYQCLAVHVGAEQSRIAVIFEEEEEEEKEQSNK